MIFEEKRSHSRDWRWMIIFCALLYMALVAAVSSKGPHAAEQILQGLGVPALECRFMDMRGVAAWCEAWSAGKNPAIEPTWIKLPGENPHPNFLMNYSPLVLGLSGLGLSPEHVMAWSLLLGFIYLSALWFLCGRCSFPQACFWVLLVCSPASALVVERGNLDILIFAFMVLALLFRTAPIVESGVILAAALIKFFPIPALLAVWRSGGKKGRLSAVTAGILFLLFLFLIRSRIPSVCGSLEGQYQSAFGCGVAADLLGHYGILQGNLLGNAHLLLRLVAFVGGLVGFLIGCRNCREESLPEISARSLHAFFLGMPILGLLFLFGNQMDYKWIFLLLMVPATLEMRRGARSFETILSTGWLILMTTYSYWTFFSDEGSLRNALLKQALMWGIVIGSTILAGRLWKRSSRL